MAGAKSKKREELTLGDPLLRPGVSIGLGSEVANACVRLVRLDRAISFRLVRAGSSASPYAIAASSKRDGGSQCGCSSVALISSSSARQRSSTEARRTPNRWNPAHAAYGDKWGGRSQAGRSAGAQLAQVGIVPQRRAKLLNQVRRARAASGARLHRDGVAGWSTESPCDALSLNRRGGVPPGHLRNFGACLSNSRVFPEGALRPLSRSLR
jgi:hypothetical protein